MNLPVKEEVRETLQRFVSGRRKKPKHNRGRDANGRLF